MNIEGMKVVVTGAFAGRTREEIVEGLRSKGAQVVDQVTPDVGAVFAGDAPGAETDSAFELGISVRSESALVAVLEGGEAPREVVDGYDDYMMSGDEDVPMWGDDDMPPPVPVEELVGTPAPRTRGGGNRGGASAPPAGVFDKGARVKIVSGLEGVGVIGEIFWWGNSKFGEGMRAGVRGPGDQTFWVDEEHLGWPDDEIPEEVKEAAKEAAQFGRGDRVRVISGRNEGDVGEIFWWGPSKYGEGMRAGITRDDGEKIWADAAELGRADAASAPRGATAPQITEDDIPF